MNHPLISVCIPVYNDERHIGEAVESALNQDYPNLEILISDNASTDKTHQIVTSYHRVSAVRHSQFVSMPANWNRFRHLVRGEWVLFLCSDDVLRQNALSSCMAVVGERVDAVFFEYDYLIDHRTEPKAPFYQHSAWIPSPQQHGVFIIGNNFPLTMALVRRNTLDAIGWFDESYHFCTDWHLWLKITASRSEAAVAYLRDPLALYRVHPGSETGRCIRDRTALAEVIRMKNDFLQRHGGDPLRLAEIARASRRGIARLARRYADAMSEAGDLATAEYYEQLYLEHTDPAAIASSSGGPPWPLPPHSVKLPR